MPKISNKNKTNIQIHINTEKKNKKSRKSHAHRVSPATPVSNVYIQQPAGGILNRAPTDFSNPLVEQERINEQNKAIQNYHRNAYFSMLGNRENYQLNTIDTNLVNTSSGKLPIPNNESYDIYYDKNRKIDHLTPFENPMYNEETVFDNQENDGLNFGDVPNVMEAEPMNVNVPIVKARKQRSDKGVSRGIHTATYLKNIMQQNKK